MFFVNKRVIVLGLRTITLLKEFFMVKSQDIVVLVKLISIEKMIIKFNDLYQDEYNFYYLNDRSYDSQKFLDRKSVV